MAEAWSITGRAWIVTEVLGPKDLEMAGHGGSMGGFGVDIFAYMYIYIYMYIQYIVCVYKYIYICIYKYVIICLYM